MAENLVRGCLLLVVLIQSCVSGEPTRWKQGALERTVAPTNKPYWENPDYENDPSKSWPSGVGLGVGHPNSALPSAPYITWTAGSGPDYLSGPSASSVSGPDITWTAGTGPGPGGSYNQQEPEITWTAGTGPGPKRQPGKKSWRDKLGYYYPGDYDYKTKPSYIDAMGPSGEQYEDYESYHHKPHGNSEKYKSWRNREFDNYDYYEYDYYQGKLPGARPHRPRPSGHRDELNPRRKTDGPPFSSSGSDIFGISSSGRNALLGGLSGLGAVQYATPTSTQVPNTSSRDLTVDTKSELKLLYNGEDLVLVEEVEANLQNLNANAMKKLNEVFSSSGATVVNTGPGLPTFDLTGELESQVMEGASELRVQGAQPPYIISSDYSSVLPSIGAAELSENGDLKLVEVYPLMVEVLPTGSPTTTNTLSSTSGTGPLIPLGAVIDTNEPTPTGLEKQSNLAGILVPPTGYER